MMGGEDRAVVLMLAPHMSLGYGVAEVVSQYVEHLRRNRIDVVVGCLDEDGHYARLQPRIVPPRAESVLAVAADVGAVVVVAHATPYFEVLPDIAGEICTVAVEHGDPLPELFGTEAATRRRIAEHKRSAVYPYVHAVVAISEFIRQDIGWPDARVIRHGVDHFPRLGPKGARRAGRLRVGALMRMGSGEAHYKGAEELRQLARSLGPGVDLTLMGRGSAEDAEPYERVGIRTLRNATDDQRIAFLRDLDVFVTTSLWEGTNLPLLEAQALATPGLAFDTGAHPEFTPWIMTGVPEMAEQLHRYAADPPLAVRHGEISRRFVWDRFRWESAACELIAVWGGATGSPPATPSPLRRGRARLQRVRRSLRDNGVRATLQRRAG